MKSDSLQTQCSKEMKNTTLHQLVVGYSIGSPQLKIYWFIFNTYKRVYQMGCDRSWAVETQDRSRGRGRGGGGSSPPPEIFRLELNSATKVEFFLLKWTAVNGS